MRQLTKKFVEFVKKEDGPTAVEYAVMLALIIVVCIAAITTLGSNANNTFSRGATLPPPAGRCGRSSRRNCPPKDRGPPVRAGRWCVDGAVARVAWGTGR